ncbi:hypothetical protein IJ425_03255, partial [bacterium]|nr:hypothetical protein [bacterium]
MLCFAETSSPKSQSQRHFDTYQTGRQIIFALCCTKLHGVNIQIYQDFKPSLKTKNQNMSAKECKKRDKSAK